MDETCSFCPAIAVPTTVKIPEPMTAPIPREVRLSQPSDFFNRRSARPHRDLTDRYVVTRNSLPLGTILPRTNSSENERKPTLRASLRTLIHDFEAVSSVGVARVECKQRK